MLTMCGLTEEQILYDKNSEYITFDKLSGVLYSYTW